MNKFVLRQLRTTFLLILALALIIFLTLYMHWNNSFVQVSAPTSATEEDIAEALIRYKTLPEDQFAQIRTSSEHEDHWVELVFSGLTNPEATIKLTQLLAQYDLHPTFYLTLSEIANSAENLTFLLENGGSVGLWGNGSGSVLNDADPEGLVEQLCRAAVMLRARHGISCENLLTTAQPVTESLRAAAAVGIKNIMVASYQIDLAECLTQEDASRLLENIPQGAVVQVHISRKDADPSTGLLYLLQAMEAADPLTPYRTMLEAYGEQELPTPMQRVHTTERAVCLTFSGMGNSTELTHILSVLDAQNAKAMFFVDYQEARSNKKDIRRILAAGHALGIKPVDDLEDNEALLLYQLTLAEQALQSIYGCEGPFLVRSGVGRPSQALIRAAAAGGYTLLSNILTPVQAGDERATDMESILTKTLAEGTRVLQRGEILHFRMNFYLSSDTLLSNLVTAFLTRRSIYPAKALPQVMANEALCYTYPLPQDQILPEVRNLIRPGQLTQDVMEVFPSHYVGTDWINNELTLPGFTPEEISRLDTLGLIPNEDNMVFLTFDDWGSDANLTRILDVLAKHEAKATFFVYTENVVNNPNLLRAIAVEGHAVASHTHRHVPLSNTRVESYGYLSLEPQQVTDLRADLVDSYRTMQAIIGDVSCDGYPALTSYFRPPTLALSREGVEAVYDTGYTWIISGSCSTEDYIATDVDSLVGNMLAGTQSGAVLVMHMTDSSIYTADALDAYLTQLEEEGAPYRFVTLTEALENQ